MGPTRLLLGALLAITPTISVLATTQQPAPQQTAPQQKPGPEGEQAPVFRGGVELVGLSVTVTDQKGRLVTDLTKEDFLVFEDKKQQEILNFTTSKDKVPIGIGLGLVVDASGSMTPDKIDATRTAVQILLDKLKKDDQFYYMEFAAASQLLLPWTNDKNAVLSAIRRLKTKTGTSIYDAIGDALPVSATGKAKKQAILVLTDGADTTSKINRTQLAEAARASDVLLYVFVVDNEEGIRQKGGDATVRQAAQELSGISAVTGGRTLYLQGFQQLEQAIEDLGKEVTQQYFMEYQRDVKDGKYHDIIVGVRRKDVVVRHRRGYLAD